jgi:transposase InsO family protein
MDRPTGRVVRRIETHRCGELVHIDVKKLARVPPGGGHKMLGRTTETKRRSRARRGYSHIHTAIDAYSRPAYSEFAGPETADNCVAFRGRAVAWFAAQGITIARVLTDNGVGYRSTAWARRCAQLGIRHSRTRPYRPATNGKAERFNRTLLDEWAYAWLWTSDARRARALDPWRPLQQSPPPHRHRRPTRQPSHQPRRAQQLVRQSF